VPGGEDIPVGMVVKSSRLAKATSSLRLEVRFENNANLPSQLKPHHSTTNNGRRRQHT
jgi:hypothetical protein